MDFAQKRFPDDAKLFIEAKEFSNLTNIKKLYFSKKKQSFTHIDPGFPMLED